MASNSELVVKITAENKEFTATIGDTEKKAEDLDKSLGNVAKTSGVLFAGLAASAGFAIKSFGDSEKASKGLELALQNQGIASSKLIGDYKALANEVSRKTGIDDDAITAGQAILQNFLGQTEVSSGLTDALADLSEKTGSVESAAEILGRGIAGNTKGLKQFGIVIDESLSKEERLAAITEQVSQKFGGLAETNNKGVGSFRGLQTALGNFVENIGERLAPTFEVIVQGLTKFFNELNKNGPLLDFVVEIGKIAAILTGVVATVATTALAVSKVSQAFAAAQAAVTAFGLAGKVAVGATGLGLLLIVIAEVALNWNKIFPVLKGVFETFVNNVGAIASALGILLSGVFSFNPAKIRAGIAEVQAIISTGLANIQKASDEQSSRGLASGEKEIQQQANKAEAAKKANAQIMESERIKNQLIIAQNEEIALTLEDASKAQIDLKREEIETLKQLEDEKYKNQKDALEAHLEEVRSQQEEANQTAIEQQQTFDALGVEQQAASLGLSEQQTQNFLLKKQASLQANLDTENTARQKIFNDQLNKQIEANNKYLVEQQKYGTAYAAINRIIYNEQVQGATKGFQELTALQQSNNSSLKAIGKAAAVAQITYQTAVSAMNIYTGFSIIPIVGPALGIAGAIAAVAFGAEQIGKVLSAAEGGIVPGFNTGGDSVPSVLQAGEFVVPRQNFSEVVNAVANERSSQGAEATSGVATGVTGGGAQDVRVNLEFSGDNAEKFLTARRVEARSLGTLRDSA